MRLEKDLYEKHKKKPNSNNLDQFTSVCLLSLKWQQDYYEFLDTPPPNKKVYPVNSNVISKENSLITSRMLKRSDDKQGLNEILCPGLSHRDFIMLDEELMDFLLSKYKGYKLKRNVINNGYHDIFIEYFPLRVLKNKFQF